MAEYIPIASEVTFFHHRRSGEYVVIHKGLPFAAPKGDISMVVLNPDKSQEFVDNLVTGTLYEYEPRPDDPKVQTSYDEVVRLRVDRQESRKDMRAHGWAHFPIGS